jgi:hypothetical protein
VIRVRRIVLLFASTALAVLLACGVTLVAPGVLAQTQQKPNIIYILTDDLDTYTLNPLAPGRPGCDLQERHVLRPSVLPL